ncbi:MAG: glycoside hydrolase family 3 N-terminal domain-containing protein [Anaerolineae bacterium]
MAHTVSTSPSQLSRRQFLKLAGQGMAATALLGGCAPSPESSTEQDGSLDVKIGQMLMVGFRGLKVGDDDPIVQDIRDRHLGGVVLFDYDVPTKTPVRNIESPAQVKALVEALQAVSPTPLLVAIDQEGGKIRRLKEKFGFPPTVSHQYLGAMNDLALTDQHATAMAQTLAQLGINLNLAPVVDLNTNPDNPIIGQLERSFSADPDIVTNHALEFIRAHHEQGVLCTLKHFPGHGSSADDSHLGLVDVTDTWVRTELEPYANIIQVGETDAIMTAHVFNANLDPEYPATLSKRAIAGVLREELDYDGVVISDDMQMGAIANHYGFEHAIQATIEGGVDIIAIANNSVYEEGIAGRTVALVKQLVRDDKISEARINESYQRIQRLKGKLSKGKS